MMAVVILDPSLTAPGHTFSCWPDDEYIATGSFPPAQQVRRIILPTTIGITQWDLGDVFYCDHYSESEPIIGNLRVFESTGEFCVLKGTMSDSSDLGIPAVWSTPQRLDPTILFPIEVEESRQLFVPAPIVSSFGVTIEEGGEAPFHPVSITRIE